MGFGEEDHRGDAPFFPIVTGTHAVGMSVMCRDARDDGLGSARQVSPRHTCSFSLFLLVYVDLPGFGSGVLGSSIRLTPVSPRGGQIQEETLGRMRLGLRSDQSGALACGGGEPGRQTECQARRGNPHMAPSQRRVLSPGPLRGPQASFIAHIRA